MCSTIPHTIYLAYSHLSQNLPRRTCYLCIKCKALPGLPFCSFGQSTSEPLITFGIKNDLWQWVPQSNSLPPGMLFLCCKPIILFHAPLLLHGGKAADNPYQRQQVEGVPITDLFSPRSLICVCKDSNESCSVLRCSSWGGGFGVWILPEWSVTWLWAIWGGILTPWPSWPPFRQVMPGGRDHGQKSRVSILQYC